MESIQAIKQRFGIIGNDPGLNRAIEKATFRYRQQTFLF